MRVIKPVEITDARLSATNVPENDENEYASGTTYATGDKVMVTDAGVHRRYESLKDSNTGNYPPDNTTGTAPAWLELGPTNRWAPFDERVGTVVESSQSYSQSTYGVEADPASPTGVAYTLVPSAPVDSIALFEIGGEFLDIIVETAAEGVIYSKRITLIEPISRSTWWHYFFEPVERRRELARFDIPRTSDATIKAAIHDSGSAAKIGALVIGRRIDLGLTQFGLRTGILDFSRKERDAFGRAVVTRRSFAREMEADFWLDRSAVPFVQRELAGLRATPAVYEGSPDDPNSLVYGFFLEFSLDIQYPRHATGTIEVEGLT